MKVELKQENVFKVQQNRKFEIDFSKVETLEDVKMVLKAMQLTIFWYQDECPPQFTELYEKGFLKEVKNDWIS